MGEHPPHRRPGKAKREPGPIAAGIRFGNAGAAADQNHERRWLWVPAFAGTTKDVDRPYLLFIPALVPPREIVGHVRRHPVLELRRAFFQERDHALLDVVGAAAGLDAAAVDLG